MTPSGETPVIKILLAALAAAGAIGAALFTFLSSKYSVDRPILATQTAEAFRVTQTVAALYIEQTAAADAAFSAAQTAEAWRAAQTATAAAAVRLPPTVPLATVPPADPTGTPAPTAEQPAFTIENRLSRPVTILIDNRRLGEAPANGERAFLLQAWPVTVEFRVRRPVTDAGDALGAELSGHWNTLAEPGTRLIMDNQIGDTRYFYLVLTNQTDTRCDVTVNKGLDDEQTPPAYLPPAGSDLTFGYYALHDTSTVWLTCGDQTWYWGQKDASDDGKPLADQLEQDSGALYLILEK